MWKESPLKISYLGAKTRTRYHWCANTCAHSSRFLNRTLKTKKRLLPNSWGPLTIKIGLTLVDRQEPKEPPSHEAWSYIQPFSGQDTTQSVHGNPTQNPNQARIQRRFTPNICPPTANPIQSSFFSTILSHNNFLEEQRLRGPLWRKSPPLAATAQQQDTLSSQRQLDHLLVITNSYNTILSSLPTKKAIRFFLKHENNANKHFPLPLIQSLESIAQTNKPPSPTWLTFQLFKPLPTIIAAIKEKSEKGRWLLGAGRRFVR